MKRRLFLSLFLSIGVFAAGAQAQGTYNTVHSFTGRPTGGEKPQHNGLVSDGNFLYGMTTFGGSAGLGSIFKIGTDGNGMTLLHSFRGSFQGDGDGPYGSLLLDGGILYGMTAFGGGSDNGQIFSYDITTGTYNSLHDFAGAPTDGKTPYGSLISDGTTLYGTTKYGGWYDLGTVFSIGKDGSNFKIIHHFSGSTNDGYLPVNDLLFEGGILYGVAPGYYIHNQGIIFSMGTDGSQFTPLHIFRGAANNDGDTPAGGLVSDGNTLYGMTAGGGSDDVGTIFSIGKDGSSYTILHNFDNTNNFQGGCIPKYSPLLEGGLLYGTAHWGGNPDPGPGTFGCGVLFSMGTDGSSFTVLHSFYDTATDGIDPCGALTSEGGALYGMTTLGGTNNLGTIFSYPLPQQLNYINLDMSPASITGGGSVAMGWNCDFSTWDYRNKPVNIYIAAIKNPKIIDAPSSVADALAGGKVYLAGKAMKSWYPYTGRLGAPTWQNAKFPPAPTSGSKAITMPGGAAFQGTWVFAAVFIYADGTGFVRGDKMPVENSNGFQVQ